LGAVPAESLAAADYYHEVVVACMNRVRESADLLETMTDKSCWPFPTYSDMLFY